LCYVPIIINKLLSKKNIEAYEIIDWLKISISTAPTIHLALQDLIRKGLIKRKLSRWTHESSTYQLAELTEKAIIQGNKQILNNENIITFEKFIERFSEIFEDIENEQAYYEDINNEIYTLWEDFKIIPFLKWCSQFNLDLASKIILSSMLHHHFLVGTEQINVEHIINLTEKKQIKRQKLKISLIDRTNKLLEYNLIDFGRNQFASIDNMILNESVLENIGEPFYQVTNPKKLILKRGELIMPDEIDRETLFFNRDQEFKINQIETLLQPEKYEAALLTLQKNQLCNSFTVLLFGAPGTGKTSSVKSIAKSSNRPIYHVETEKIRDMYVGASEKHLAEIFSEYYKCQKHLGIDPILLLNEADSLLGSRVNAKSGAEKMENTMANILLEKLETFKGILIATTNMTENLDYAFERRILFKIAIDKPDKITQRKIIESNFITLSQSIIDKTLRDFNLTGAEINNIKKKFLITGLINNEVNINDCFYELCQEEFSMSNKKRNKIGFC
jgi:predicted transcriptional regulator